MVYNIMCNQADVATKYTNHSLRATATSKMFFLNVPEKIIAEKTGHRSLAGLRAYEHITHAQEQAITKSLSSSNAVFTDCLPQDDQKDVMPSNAK